MKGGRATILLTCMTTFMLACVNRVPAVPLRASSNGAVRVFLSPTLKLSALAAYDDGERMAYSPERSALGLYRLRLGVETSWSRVVTLQLAYEQSGRWTSRDNLESASSGLLPPTSDPFFRCSSISGEICERDRLTCRHELDRALVSFHPQWGEITVGRQAIGLGRGRLFSAVDLFAPFSPAEVDREWRRGVDAVRVEYRVVTTWSVEGIAVSGDSGDESAAMLRARGYVGRVDAELMGGRRGEDGFLGAVCSLPWFEAELHAEAAVFHVPEPHPESGLWGDDRWVPKGVVGTSYTFDIGNGLTCLVEYHYSGFGARDIRNAPALFGSGEHRVRYQRGDTQMLGRQGVGVQSSYPLNESVTGALTLLASPDDGSGALNPSVRWDASRSASLVLCAFMPWGKDVRDGIMHSEYGSAPFSVFAQLAMYF